MAGLPGPIPAASYQLQGPYALELRGIIKCLAIMEPNDSTGHSADQKGSDPILDARNLMAIFMRVIQYQ